MTIRDLKNTVKVAKNIQKTEVIKHKYHNDKRSISIALWYHPVFNKSEDIYPYWVVDMLEEARFKKMYFGANDLKDVRDLFNSFIQQGENSFLENYKPY